MPSLVARLRGWLADDSWLADVCPASHRLGWLLATYLSSWLASGWLVGWLTGWLVGWLAGWLIGAS